MQRKQITVISFYLLNAGIPHKLTNELAPKSSSTVCLPLVQLRLHTD